MHLIFFFLLFINNTFANKAEFEKNHQNYLDGVREKSQLILNEDFNFTGIEVVYVQTGKAYYSWLGHILLRFVGSGETPEKDLGVSFVADFNDYELDNLKAYYGGYQVLPVVDRWENYVSDYFKKENRYLDRFEYLSNEKTREKIKETLRSWIRNPDLAGTYSFRRNSCTALLIKLLASADQDINPKEILFPSEIVPYLKSLKKIGKSYSRIK